MRFRIGRVIAATAAALVVVAFFAASLGTADIDNVWKYIFNPTLNQASSAHNIIWEIRIPRILAAILVGAILGISGVLAQGATNNPIADPAIIGTSAGASLGVVIAVLLNVATIGSPLAVAFAFLGAVAATFVVFALSKTSMQLIIIGIGISAILTAAVGLIVSTIERPDARSISFWSLGSFALVTQASLWVLAAVLFVGSIAAWKVAPSLDLLSLGDTSMRHLGFDPQRARLKIFLIFATLIAASVSVVGTISFLALATPHIARNIIGPQTKKLIPFSAVLGALILLIADTAARTLVPPFDLPIGLITSLIGAPILILAVKKSAQVWR
jgi:iron complex transport system permease protein